MSKLEGKKEDIRKIINEIDTFLGIKGIDAYEAAALLEEIKLQLEEVIGEEGTTLEVMNQVSIVTTEEIGEDDYTEDSVGEEVVIEVSREKDITIEVEEGYNGVKLTEEVTLNRNDYEEVTLTKEGKEVLVSKEDGEDREKGTKEVKKKELVKQEGEEIVEKGVKEDKGVMKRIKEYLFG